MTLKEHRYKMQDYNNFQTSKPRKQTIEGKKKNSTYILEL